MNTEAIGRLDRSENPEKSVAVAHRQKALITGATGFIGRRLIKQLTSSGSLDLRALTRGQGATIGAGVEVIENFDLTAPKGMDQAVADIDCIVHLAARVHVTPNIDRAEIRRYDKINIDGTIALARAAARAGVRRFVFVSTIAVNGTQTEPGAAFTEDDPRRPDHPYAYSKGAAEKGLEAIARQTGMEVAIIRPPLVYGPGVKGNFLRMKKFIRHGVPLPFGAVTNNRRSLIALDNLVDLIEISLKHPDAANQIFLASDGQALSTADLLRRLSLAMDKRPRLFSLPTPALEWIFKRVGLAGEARRLLKSLVVDSSKAERVLGWKPRLSVDEGLRLAAADQAD